jgi:hypothetical protein
VAAPDGKVLFGAAGSVTVGDSVECELEIERSGSETSIEIEFTWKDAAAADQAKASESDEDEAEEEEEEEEEEEGDEEPAAQPTAIGVAEVAPITASSPVASVEGEAGTDDVRPTSAAH